MVTNTEYEEIMAFLGARFPINRCHQRVVTIVKLAILVQYPEEFPINRCHQRVVTNVLSLTNCGITCFSFQSIGVTSEW